jgi:hypothetical protein
VKLRRSAEAGIRPSPRVNCHAPDRVAATVPTVTNKKLWVIAGVIGAASVAGLPAISAHADYPPGTSYKVSVDHGTGSSYTVSVVGADPSCTFRVVSANHASQTQVLPNGTASVTIDIGSKTGTRPLIAKTISCKYKETYKTKVVTTTNQIKGPIAAKQGEKITLKALGWSPEQRVVITLATTEKGVVKTKALKPNSSGNVFWKITAPKPGTYAVTFTQQGPPSVSQSYTLTINPKKAPKKH